MTYEKSFKEEAVRLSDEIDVKKAAEQLGVPYYTLADWRVQRKRYSAQAYVGSGHKRVSADPKEQRIYELEKRTVSFSGQTRFCRRHSVFSQKAGRSKSAVAVRICGGARQQMACHSTVSRVEAQ